MYSWINFYMYRKPELEQKRLEHLSKEGEQVWYFILFHLVGSNSITIWLAE